MTIRKHIVKIRNKSYHISQSKQLFKLRRVVILHFEGQQNKNSLSIGACFGLHSVRKYVYLHIHTYIFSGWKTKKHKIVYNEMPFWSKLKPCEWKNNKNNIISVFEWLFITQFSVDRNFECVWNINYNFKLGLRSLTQPLMMM